MKPSFHLIALGMSLALTACNSTRPTIDLNDDIHKHHTPAQHAAFLKRVGQLQTDDEAGDPSGISGGGGGGGHHH